MPNAVPTFDELMTQHFRNLSTIRVNGGGARISIGTRGWERAIRSTPELKKPVVAQNLNLSLRNAPTVLRIPGNTFRRKKASVLKFGDLFSLVLSYEISEPKAPVVPFSGQHWIEGSTGKNPETHRYFGLREGAVCVLGCRVLVRQVDGLAENYTAARKSLCMFDTISLVA